MADDPRSWARGPAWMARALWLLLLPLGLGCDIVASDGNQDGVVNILDVSLVSSCQGLDPAGDPRCAEADVDGDGDVDRDDLDAVTASFGQCVDPFPNGVAAGDVDQSSVVLWARADFDGLVHFEWGRDPDFATVPDGDATLDADPDVPAKVYVSDLDPGTQYYYRACRGEECPSLMSSTCEAHGSFRTPFADGFHGLRFGVSSCWREDMKPFVSIRNAADRELDFFVALGDTVYADSPDSGEVRARTLAQFRRNHALAYTANESPEDNHFARLRASTASFISIDDHEVVNDFAGGAPPLSHVESCECNGNPVTNLRPDCPRELCFCDPVPDPDGPDSPDPRNCFREFINETDLYLDAMQALHEYNPIREERYGDVGEPTDTGDPRTRGKPKLYRHRTFGRDAALFVLDARSFRDEADLVRKLAPGRTMLGEAQLRDLTDDLRAAEQDGITWKLVMIPEPIQHLDPFTAKDRFTGYLHERALLLDFIERECISNVVFIAGDIHATIVNNLSYKNPPLYLQRLSSAWEISTGAAAYHKAIGPALTLSSPSDDHQFYDRIFQLAINVVLQLYDRPATGLGLERYGVPPLQQWNRSVPATLLAGSYVAAHTYGWTEFEIDSVTQRLRVTTYGVDWYEPAPNTPPQRDDYATQAAFERAQGQYDEALAVWHEDVESRQPFVVSEFEVATSCGCQPLVCTNDGDCCENSVCNLLGGDQGELLPTCVRQNSLENGDLCSTDDACQSGICVLGRCGGCQPAGDVCGETGDCCGENVCSTLVCLPPGSLDALTPCTNDEVCRSGSCVRNLCEPVCGDGYCDRSERCGGNDVTGLQCRSDCGQCSNGVLCGDDNMCVSGLCNGGICTFPQDNGSPCVRDEGCESGLCNAGFCTLPQDDGSFCLRDDGCESGLCDLGICTAPNSRPALRPCASGVACQSGSCTLGTCEQVCGDGFCDGIERCGGNDVTGLQCRSDCGQCPNGALCGDDNMCVSGLCNGGICTLPQDDGTPCVRNEGCLSGLCDLGICTALNSRPALRPCASGDACRSGSCTLGTCEQICGDGFCDGTEQCGALRPLSCTADCSLCPANSVCVGDVDCVDGACNFLRCTAPLPIGSLCSRDSACQSGRCFGGVCLRAR